MQRVTKERRDLYRVLLYNHPRVDGKNNAGIYGRHTARTLTSGFPTLTTHDTANISEVLM